VQAERARELSGKSGRAVIELLRRRIIYKKIHNFVEHAYPGVAMAVERTIVGVAKWRQPTMSRGDVLFLVASGSHHGGRKNHRRSCQTAAAYAVMSRGGA
jgi:hypothetical protein